MEHPGTLTRPAVELVRNANISGVSRRTSKRYFSLRICDFRKSEARSRETRKADSNADSPILEGAFRDAKIGAGQINEKKNIYIYNNYIYSNDLPSFVA